MKFLLSLSLACLVFSSAVFADTLEQEYDQYSESYQAKRDAELVRCETKRMTAFKGLIKAALGNLVADSRQNIISIKSLPIKPGEFCYAYSYRGYAQITYAKLQNGSICEIHFSLDANSISTLVSLRSWGICRDSRGGASVVYGIDRSLKADAGCSYLYPHGR